MTDVLRKPVATGGCQCGAIRYALYAQPEGAHLCHCRMCQKAMGNLFAPLAPVRQEDFAWTCGTPRLFRSSSVAERGFCPECGTPLSFRDTDSEWLSVTIGSLDQPDAVPPVIHYGVERRVVWLHLADMLPEERTEDEPSSNRLASMVNYQHPDYDSL